MHALFESNNALQEPFLGDHLLAAGFALFLVFAALVTAALLQLTAPDWQPPTDKEP